MGFIRRHKLLTATVVILVVVVGTFVVRFLASFLPVPLVISKETTYITEPLRPDGTPDYLVAINQECSKGVTPENNAAVLFWKAAGPAPIPVAIRARYFHMLNMPLPPVSGDYFVELEEWGERRKQVDAEATLKLVVELSAAVTRPWSKKEYPLLAEWLAANEKPLRVVVAGSKRPRRYDSLICDDSGERKLTNVCVRGTHQCRVFARCLVLRAMLRIDEGKPEDAWADLLACHRLARLAGQGPFLAEVVIANSIDDMALNGDRALLQHTRLTALQIERMRKDLAELPPMPRMVDKAGRGERFEVLDFALQTNARDLGVRESGVDWNVVLRMINSRFDQLVAAVGQSNRGERLRAIEDFGGELKDDEVEAKSRMPPAEMILNRRKVVSRQVGLIVISMLTPEMDGVTLVEDRMTMGLELTDIAFALAQYRSEHGRYPAKLADLVPKYVKAVPKDIFAGDAELHYKPQGDGYLLYSVGKNGKDDGGKQEEEAKNGEGWDDLTVRMTGGKT